MALSWSIDRWRPAIEDVARPGRVLQTLATVVSTKHENKSWGCVTDCASKNLTADNVARFQDWVGTYNRDENGSEDNKRFGELHGRVALCASVILYTENRKNEQTGFSKTESQVES